MRIGFVSLAGALALAVVLGGSPAFAEMNSLKPSGNSQQSKMTTCNAEAKTKNLSGEPRKAFMSKCLSNKPAEDTKTLTPQQQKMTTCNADAKTKNLAGDARKAFMSTCLKGTP